MEMAEATAVTLRDAIMSAKIPNSAGSEVGYQYLPKIKSLMATFSNMGRPSIKRNITIRVSTVIDARAMQKKTILIAFSFLLRALPF
jgi:hypothetical protein